MTNADRNYSFEEKQLRLMRLQTYMTAAILLILLVGSAFAAYEFKTIHSSLKMAEEKLEQIDVAEITAATDSLKDAADTLAAMDMSSMNTTAESLREAADNLAQLDTDAFNEVVTSLQNVSSNLESVSNKLSGLFGN